MKHLFKEKAQVLIATESGREGINLQFCHHVINYDLPWNPDEVGATNWACPSVRART